MACPRCGGVEQVTTEGRMDQFPTLVVILRACTECEQVALVPTQGTLRQMARLNEQQRQLLHR